MKFPKFIKPGDEISLIAPSFSAATKPYITPAKRGVYNLSKRGYVFNISEDAFDQKLPYLSNTPENIAKDFLKHYTSNSKALLSSGGGEFEIETLAYFDFDKIKQLEPKWFMGFSDNTNLCFLLLTISEVASIDGPCIHYFSYFNVPYNAPDALALLEGSKDTLHSYPYYSSPWNAYQKKHPLSGPRLNIPQIINKIPNKDFTIEGRLIGGNIDLLSLICGTKFDNVKNFLEKYKQDGFIWFLEACDLDPISIRRVFTQLKYAGWFKYIKGLVFGRIKTRPDQDIFGVNKITMFDPLLELNIPIIADFDFGHIDCSMPVILGSYATVKTKGNDVTVKMACK